MTTSKSTITAATMLAALALAGCSGGPGAEMAPLDAPAMVTADKAEESSQVTLYQRDATQPENALVTDLVTGTSLKMMVSDSGAMIETLTISLADVDLGPTTQNPAGVKLRKQQLTLSTPVAATTEQRERDALTVHGQSSLVYSASRLLDDGTLAPLGDVTSNRADFDVRATRYESGVHVTIDAGPQGECWNVPGVVDVTDCSIYIETDGSAQSLGSTK